MTTDNIHDIAYSKIDGWAIRAGVMKQLGVNNLLPGRPAAATIPTRPSAVATVEDEIEKLLLAGKEIPEDIGSIVVEAEKNDALALARVQALNTVAAKYANTSSLITSSSTIPAFAYLRDELNALVAEVRTHAPALEGIADPAQAMSAGPKAIEGWQTVLALTGRYNAIRETQLDLLKASVDQSVTALLLDSVNRSAHFKRAVEFHPSWIERRRESALGVPLNSAGDVLKYREWLLSCTPSAAYEAGIHPVAQLVLFCTDLEPWIPTVEEFEQETVAGTYITQRPNSDNTARLAVARDAYLAGEPVPTQDPVQSLVWSGSRSRAQAYAYATSTGLPIN